MSGLLTPDGEHLWWFDDTKGNEKGVWRTQSFEAEAPLAEPATDLDPGYPAGLAFAVDGVAAIGMAGDGMHRVYLSDGVRPSRLVHEHPEAAVVAGWSCDGSLLAFSHAEHGDNRNLALRVIDRQGTVVADLWEGPIKGVIPERWSPRSGDERLMLIHVRDGKNHPAIWSPRSGELVDLDVEIDGELVMADWLRDIPGVLLVTVNRGRGKMWRHDLESSLTTAVDTPPGMVMAARVRPDGEIWWVGSSGSTPNVVHCGDEVLRPPGDAAPGGSPYEELTAEGPGGSIHSFVARPGGPGPHPTIFHVHGGPAGVDADFFSPSVQAWVDHGYAVVMVNYRGSNGFGKDWLDAIVGKPGYREVEDLAAVRDRVVAEGIADPERIILHGGSWGGYLTLLGVGTRPELWSLGIALVPIASLRDHYAQQSEPLQAYWRSLFGGTPETLGAELDDIDPICHVDRIAAPVLVMVGDNDPRCPLGQVLTYVDALERAGVEHELYQFDAGHMPMVTDDWIDLLERSLAFASKHLGTTEPIREEPVGDL